MTAEGVTYIGVDLQVYGSNLHHDRLEHWFTTALAAAVEAYNNESADSEVEVWEFSEFEHAGDDDEEGGGISGPWEGGIGVH